MGGKGWDFRNNYKGQMDITKGGWNQGREVGMAGVGGAVGGKCRQLYLNTIKQRLKKSLFYVCVKTFTSP